MCCGRVLGVSGEHGADFGGVGTLSDDGVDPGVRGEQIASGWPAIGHSDDVASSAPHDARGGVPQRPAQPFWFGFGEWSGAGEVLEPADQIGTGADEVEPGAVGVQVTERESFEAGVLQSFDVVLDVGVSRMCASNSTGEPVASV